MSDLRLYQEGILRGLHVSWTAPDAMEPTHRRPVLMHPRHTRGGYLLLAMPDVTEEPHVRLGPHLLHRDRGVSPAAAAPVSSSQTLWVVRSPKWVLSHLFNPGKWNGKEWCGGCHGE